MWIALTSPGSSITSCDKAAGGPETGTMLFSSMVCRRGTISRWMRSSDSVAKKGHSAHMNWYSMSIISCAARTSFIQKMTLSIGFVASACLSVLSISSHHSQRLLLKKTSFFSRSEIRSCASFAWLAWLLWEGIALRATSMKSGSGYASSGHMRHTSVI